jgi:hypothetical protein
MYLETLPLSQISMVILAICIAWLVLIATLPNPAKTKVEYIDLGDTDPSKHSVLHDTDGCIEWYINDTENIIIVRYNSDIITPQEIQNLIK